jgi:hypothetical protein
MSDQPLTVARITAPDFVATFETADGVVGVPILPSPS